MVTSDDKFVRTVRDTQWGACEDSRVLPVDEGLELAETWLGL